MSHCRHRVTLVTLITSQTISKHYVADWPKNLKKFKHFSLVRKEENLADVCLFVYILELIFAYK